LSPVQKKAAREEGIQKLSTVAWRNLLDHGRTTSSSIVFIKYRHDGLFAIRTRLLR
jgi:hypothetical protein